MEWGLVVAGIGLAVMSLVHICLYVIGLHCRQRGIGIAAGAALFLLAWAVAFVGMGVHLFNYGIAVVLMIAASLVAATWMVTAALRDG